MLKLIVLSYSDFFIKNFFLRFHSFQKPVWFFFGTCFHRKSTFNTPSLSDRLQVLLLILSEFQQIN